MDSRNIEKREIVPSNQEVTMEAIKNEVNKIVSREMIKLSSNIGETIMTIQDKLDSEFKSVTTNMSAIQTQKTKRQLTSIIDDRLRDRYVRKENLKDARDWVKREILLTGDYQDVMYVDHSIYNQITNSIASAIGECKRYNEDWFVIDRGMKEQLQITLEDALEKLNEY